MRVYPFVHTDTALVCTRECVIASEASLLHELAGAFLWYIFVSMGTFGPVWPPVTRNA